MKAIHTRCLLNIAGCRYLFISFLMLVGSLHSMIKAQDYSRMNFLIVDGSVPLTNPFAGGLKAPQFSNIDFNMDGKNDLFVFDRNGDIILPFVKTGLPGQPTYAYTPEIANWFPRLESWALIRDYNKDNVPDIFSASTLYPGCIEVWKGTRNPQGYLQFRRIIFSYGIPEIVQFLSFNQYTNIYASSIDLPAVEDVDSDGDLDILSFDPDGSFAGYFKNTSVEQGLGLDSLHFVRGDLCWGKFGENQFNDGIFLSNDPNTCAQGITSGGNAGSRHSGSTLCLLDTDGDEDKDLLIGDLASSRIKKLVNGGDRNKAFITSYETNFPNGENPVYIDIFLAAFYVDVDDDGKRDLIVCPNDAGNGETQEHIWFYRNTGEDNNPQFTLVTKNFLVDQMLFVNSGSHPAFADVNQDGLTDLIVGSNGMLLKDGIRKNRMVLLLNNGSEKEPSYLLADEDYLNMSAGAAGTGRLAPAIGDLDSDGDDDLLVGDAFGQLFFFENTAGQGKPYQFAAPVYPYTDVFVGQNAKPALLDLTGDGLTDLVIGEKNNQLNLLVNKGSKGNPFFNSNTGQLPNTTQLGTVFQGNDFFTQNGAPCFLETQDGNILLMGSEAASLFAFSDIENNIYNRFQLLAHPAGNVMEGRKMTLSAADIDADGYYEIAVGNDRGGLSFYNTPFKPRSSSVAQNDEPQSFQLWPNPSGGLLFINSQINQQFELNDLHGNPIAKLQPGWNDVSGVQAGCYLITAEGTGNWMAKKVILIPGK